MPPTHLQALELVLPRVQQLTLMRISWKKQKQAHLQVLELVLLHVQHDLGAAAQLLARGVARDGERPARLALPHVLLVVVVLGHHRHLRETMGKRGRGRRG